jgi:Fe-S-cluster containining protein
MDEHPPDTVSVQFEVGIGERRITATAQVPSGQTNLTQILPVLRAIDDSFIDGITTQLAAAGHPVSCRRGCGACCRQMVPISIFEAEALGNWIRTLPEARRLELKSRFHQALTKLAAAGIVDRMVKDDWLADHDGSSQLAIDYLNQRIPCPFLEDEACSIHTFRPLICREHLVTSSPDHCVNPEEGKTVGVHLPIHFARVLAHIGAEVEGAAHGCIPLLFLFAWMQSGARPGDAVAGTGPQVLYEFVKRLDEGRIPPPAEPSAGDPAANEP